MFGANINMYLVRLVLLLLPLVISPRLVAALTFESMTVKSVPERLDDVKSDALFRFKNNSDKPVSILGVKVSCGCTEYVLEKRIFGPGENGILAAIVDRSKIAGSRTVLIEVQTDDSEKPVILKIDIRLANDFVKVDSPRFLIWRRGSEPQAKRVMLAIDPKFHVIPSKLTVSDAYFTATIIPARQPGEYWVEVRPAGTMEKRGAVITPPELDPRLWAILNVYAYIL